MVKEAPSSASDTTLGLTSTVLLVLTLLVLALEIVLGTKSRTPSGSTSTPEHPSKPVSAAEERQKSGFGLRSPGYGRTPN